MKSDIHADIALDGLIKFLNKKKEDCKEKIVVENEVDKKGKGDEMNKEQTETKDMRKHKGKKKKQALNFLMFLISWLTVLQGKGKTKTAIRQLLILRHSQNAYNLMFHNDDGQSVQ
ncbi:hypothetical protein CQW23_01557 [Capsicum baccatum]|uniref:Uncharacterized protein n=1 Tax=Capsicum baccatum TaxID=33114 RepID=A0A2G2XNX3_CAPBA|nr:hypothetical protein CQW23_01557 [Capsicum baccatum]